MLINFTCLLIYKIINGNKCSQSNRVYVGMSTNPEVHLEQHNSGQVRSTKAFVPWIQFYCAKVGDRKEGRRRELELKSKSGRRYLRSLLNERSDR